MQAKDVMSRAVIHVSPGHNIRHAARIMFNSRVSGLPVLDSDGALVGMLTEGDLMVRCELGGHFLPLDQQDVPEAQRMRNLVKRIAWSVADVMTSPVTVAQENTSLADIAALFLRDRIKRVPILRNGQVVGIVSRRDLLRGIASTRPEHAIKGDDRIRISVLARLRQAEDLIGPLPEVTVHDGIVRLSGRLRSKEAQDVVRVIAETVAATLHDQTSVQGSS